MGGPTGDREMLTADGATGSSPRLVLQGSCLQQPRWGPAWPTGWAASCCAFMWTLTGCQKVSLWGIHAPSRVHTRAVADCWSYRGRKTRNTFGSPSSNTDHGQAFSFPSLGLSFLILEIISLLLSPKTVTTLSSELSDMINCRVPPSEELYPPLSPPFLP